MANDPLAVIRESDPALFATLCDMRECALGEGALSKKHKLLIALAIDAAIKSENGVRSLARQALEAGASRREIMEALRVVNYICGAGSMYAAAAALADVFPDA